MSDSTTNRKLLEVSGLETCFLPGKGRRITQESVRAVDEVDILGLPPKAMRAMRRHMQIILQDPYGSMRPRLQIGQTLEEPLRLHQILAEKQFHDAAVELLARFGLGDYFIHRYPHEMSGCQRQRTMIARALSLGISSWWPTSPSPPWTCRFRHKS